MVNDKNVENKNKNTIKFCKPSIPKEKYPVKSIIDLLSELPFELIEVIYKKSVVNQALEVERAIALKKVAQVEKEQHYSHSQVVKYQKWGQDISKLKLPKKNGRK